MSTLLAAVGEMLVLGAATVPAANRLRKEVGRPALAALLLFAYAVAGLWSLMLCARAAEAEASPARESRSRARSRSMSRDTRRRSAEALKSDDDTADGADRPFRKERSGTISGAAGAAGAAAAAAPVPATAALYATEASPRKRRRMYLPGGSVVYIVEGVAAAAVGLVKDPFVGAQREGARGFVKGIGTGLVGTVTRPARGFYKAGVNTYVGVEGMIRTRQSGHASTPKRRRRRRPHPERTGGTAAGDGSGDSDAISPATPPVPGDRSRLGSGIGGGDEVGLLPLDGAVVPGVAGSPPGSGDVQRAPQRRYRRKGMAAAGHQLLQRAGWRRGADHGAPEVCEPDGGGAIATFTNGTLAADAEGSADATGALAAGRGVSPIASKAGGGIGWEEEFSGLAIGIMLVPLVLVAVRLRLLRAGKGLEQEVAASTAADLAVTTITEDAIAVEYAEFMLEAALLCSAAAVIATAQRLVKASLAAANGGGGRWDVPGWALSGNVRLSVVAGLALRAGRHWLSCCWAAVAFDVLLQLLLAPAPQGGSGGDSSGKRPAADGSGSGSGAAVPTAAATANVRSRWRQPWRRPRLPILSVLSLRFGEAVALCQAIALWSCDGLLVASRRLNLGGVMHLCSAVPSLLPCPPARDDTAIVIQAGLLGTLLSCAALAAVAAAVATARKRPGRSLPLPPRRFLPYLVLPPCAALWLGGWMAPLLRRDPVMWVASRVAGGEARLLWNEGSFAGAMRKAATGARGRFCVFWGLALAILVPLAPRATTFLGLRRAAARKLFHFLAAAMFLPALTAEPDFLALALAVAIGAMLVVECLRSLGAPPLAAPLRRFYAAFVDARDGGAVCVTHLFLLLGCALPLWLAPPPGDLMPPVTSGSALTAPLPLTGPLTATPAAAAAAYVGVVVLGLGDAIAALVGGVYGRTRWPGSRRTLEGSVAMYAATLLPLSLLTWDGGYDHAFSGLRASVTALAWPVMLLTLMEAFTTQVDNLVLPCFGFALLAAS